MKIRFGITDSRNSPAIGLGVTAFLISYACMHFQRNRSWTHDLIVESRLLNVTPSIFNMSCGLRYDDYRCSVLPKTSNISKFCLNDAEIATIRLLPLVSYILQLWIIYELFALIEERIRFFVHALGISSILTFGELTILIYHNTCAQFCITMFLFLTSGILFMLTMRDMQVRDNRSRAEIAA